MFSLASLFDTFGGDCDAFIVDGVIDIVVFSSLAMNAGLRRSMLIFVWRPRMITVKNLFFCSITS